LVGAWVATLTEEQLHLLLGHHVPDGEVEPGEAGAQPPTRRLALLLVVGGEAGLPALGGIVSGDLLRQVRVPAPCGELVQRHHAYTKRTSEAQGLTTATECTGCVLDLPRQILMGRGRGQRCGFGG